ncbi:hypothetical protein HEP_00537400, partial [Hepatocystis sp. ex Piliocolobus tephrosceles]
MPSSSLHEGQIKNEQIEKYPSRSRNLHLLNTSADTSSNFNFNDGDDDQIQQNSEQDQYSNFNFFPVYRLNLFNENQTKCFYDKIIRPIKQNMIKGIVFKKPTEYLSVLNNIKTAVKRDLMKNINKMSKSTIKKELALNDEKSYS